MARNPAADLIQFIAGGSLFGAGGFLLLNQVMASSSFGFGPGRAWRRGGGVDGGVSSNALPTAA
jgi:hypothetical protein